MSKTILKLMLITSILTITTNAKMKIQACEKIEVFEVATSKTHNINKFSEIEIYDNGTVLVYLGYGIKPDLTFKYKYTAGENSQFITDVYQSGNNILHSWYEKHYDVKLISIDVYDESANMVRLMTFKNCKLIK